MKTEILTLCDNAQEYNGKNVIVGTFNELTAKSFPAPVMNMSLVARIATEPDETVGSELEFKIFNIADPDKPLVEFNPPVSVKKENDGKRKFLNFILKFDGMPIPEEGTYRFKLRIGDWSDDIDLYVSKI